MSKKRKPSLPDDMPSYSVDDVTKLCKKLNFDEDQLALVRSELNSMASKWWSVVSLPANQVLAGELRVELERLERASRKLLKTMAETQNGTWDAIHDASYVLRADRQESGGEDVANHKRDDYEAAHVDAPYDVTQFVAELKGIADASNVARQLQDPASAGRPRDIALDGWMQSAYALFRCKLGELFVRHVHEDGKPASHAAAFCVEAYHHLSPMTPTSLILNAMKYEISEMQKPLEEMQRNIYIFS
jgi:hypothetical protein